MGIFDTISDIGDLVTGKSQADAARYAANLQNQASQKANQTLTERYQATQGLLNPLIQQGAQTYATLGGKVDNGDFNVQGAGKFSFDPNNISSNPGYQFQLAQGQRALNQNAAAQGHVLGGAQQKQLMGFGQNLANTYQNTFFNQGLQANNQNYLQQNQQNQQQYDRYANLANQGLQYAVPLGMIGQNYGEGYGNNLIGGANALGAGEIGGVNARAGAASQLLNFLGNVGSSVIGAGTSKTPKGGGK